eukprot:9478787-Pyramimonas_sp.AAC.1
MSAAGGRVKFQIVISMMAPIEANPSPPYPSRTSSRRNRVHVLVRVTLRRSDLWCGLIAATPDR